MSLRIRPFRDEYGVLARLYSEHYARPSTEENVREFEESFPQHLCREIWLLEVAGKVMGASILTHNKAFFHPDQYEFNIWVTKEKLRQGIGNELYRFIINRVSARSAKVLQCTIPDRFEAGIRFLINRDFSENARTFPSEFSLADFQNEKYSALMNRLRDRGISIRKLSALSDPQCRDKIYALFVQLDRSIPGADLRPLRSKEEFWASVDDGSQSKDSFFVAKNAESYIGLNIGGPMPGNNEFLVKLTGVLPEYRKCGIGTALKASGMAYAKKNGFSVAATWNDSRNQPILALNEKFGFQRKAVAVSFIRRF